MALNRRHISTRRHPEKEQSLEIWAEEVKNSKFWASNSETHYILEFYNSTILELFHNSRILQ